jgi:hypothetical protein
LHPPRHLPIRFRSPVESASHGASRHAWRTNRKNSLFAGSDRGGDWAATMFTICQICRLVDWDPFQYLVEIFAEIHKGRKDYANLRPKAWERRNAVVLA